MPSSIRFRYKYYWAGLCTLRPLNNPSSQHFTHHVAYRLSPGLWDAIRGQSDLLKRFCDNVMSHDVGALRQGGEHIVVSTHQLRQFLLLGCCELLSYRYLWGQASFGSLRAPGPAWVLVPSTTSAGFRGVSLSLASVLAVWLSNPRTPLSLLSCRPRATLLRICIWWLAPAPWRNLPGWILSPGLLWYIVGPAPPVRWSCVGYMCRMRCSIWSTFSIRVHCLDGCCS